MPPRFSNDRYPGSKKTPNKKGNRIGWLFLGLLPIPIGLVLTQLHLVAIRSDPLAGLFTFFNILTLAIGLTSGVGLSWGPESKDSDSIMFGLFVGFSIAVFDLSVIYFAGCCCAFQNMH